jgi:hypothetical protein
VSEDEAGHVDYSLEESVEKGEPIHEPRMKLAMWIVCWTIP